MTENEFSTLLLEYVETDPEKRIIATWMPPSNRPKLTGMMTYSYSHKTCEIKEYLWSFSVMSGRYFEAVVKHMSKREKSPIYSISLVCTQLDYQKHLKNCGWVVSNKEPNNCLKIEFLPTKPDL